MISVDVEIDAVYIYDELGEIVTWIQDEWIEDPSVTLSIVNAIKMGYEQGAAALRASINHPIQFTESPTDSDLEFFICTETTWNNQLEEIAPIQWVTEETAATVAQVYANEHNVNVIIADAYDCKLKSIVYPYPEFSV